MYIPFSLFSIDSFNILSDFLFLTRENLIILKKEANIKGNSHKNWREKYMKFIVQRVLESSVSVDGETIGKNWKRIYGVDWCRQ